MAKHIHINSRVGHFEVELSDLEYDDIDWETSRDDTFVISYSNGCYQRFAWLDVNSVQVLTGAAPPPGTYPLWSVQTEGVDTLVDSTTKDVIEAAFTANDDVLLEFSTVQGYDIKLMVRNASAVVIVPGSLTVPEP